MTRDTLVDEVACLFDKYTSGEGKRQDIDGVVKCSFGQTVLGDAICAAVGHRRWKRQLHETILKGMSRGKWANFIKGENQTLSPLCDHNSSQARTLNRHTHTQVGSKGLHNYARLNKNNKDEMRQRENRVSLVLDWSFRDFFTFVKCVPFTRARCTGNALFFRTMPCSQMYIYHCLFVNKYPIANNGIHLRFLFKRTHTLFIFSNCAIIIFHSSFVLCVSFDAFCAHNKRLTEITLPVVVLCIVDFTENDERAMAFTCYTPTNLL